MFLRLMKYNTAMFSISAILGIILSITLVLVTSFTTSIYYPIEMWIHSQDFLTVIYPLFCTIPFCWEILSERKNNFLTSVVSRVSLRKYLVYRYIGGLLAVSIVIFLFSFSGAVFAEYIVTPMHPSIHPSKIGLNLWGGVLVNTPLQYALLLSLWRIFLADLYFTFGFILALFCKNTFIALTGPFIYSILENYIMSILGGPSYSISTAFFISRLAPGTTTVTDLLVGPCVLIATCIVILLSNIVPSMLRNTRCLDIV